MKTLVLSRRFAVEDATIGLLTIDGAFQCFTLEDVIRDAKIKHVTAIPAGQYPVILCESNTFSDRYEKKGFGRLVPLIDKVPGFSGIRIHIGNSAADSSGCVLVGQSWKDHSKGYIHDSTAAYGALIKALLADGTSHRITVKDEIGKEGGQQHRRRRVHHPSKPLYDGLYAPRPAATQGTSAAASGSYYGAP